MAEYKKLRTLDRAVGAARQGDSRQVDLSVEKLLVESVVSASYVINADELATAMQLVGVPYRQLMMANPQISCNPGLCLVYAREVFGVGPKYPTAMKGWGASEYRHEDKKYPHNMWVPIWFSLSDNPAGHVAVRQPDGSIWSASHPTSFEPVHHESLTDMEKYYSNRLTYLGWTEDIEGIRVVGRS